jgi:hypothetical protein
MLPRVRRDIFIPLPSLDLRVKTNPCAVDTKGDR